mgnify:FL=1|tara:strand:+ start:140 stop:538 length:399 start_codon:yes stop_codon:yes gene_type:complete
MATKKITFDPDAGVPVASNLTIYTGADFNATFDVYNVSNSAYSLANGGFTTDWSGSAQIQKSAGVAATTTPSATFTVGVTTAGKITLALGSTDTDSLSQGRYLYNVLVSSGATIYNMIDGNILVYTGIASSP